MVVYYLSLLSFASYKRKLRYESDGGLIFILATSLGKRVSERRLLDRLLRSQLNRPYRIFMERVKAPFLLVLFSYLTLDQPQTAFPAFCMHRITQYSHPLYVIRLVVASRHSYSHPSKNFSTSQKLVSLTLVPVC